MKSDTLENPSDSVEMYLVTIARLREGDQPVPLSHLADALEVTSVSVNEMCRKLQDNGLLSYQPYKGVTLTDEGEQLANKTLKRRCLWEIFLEEKLNFSKEEADVIACGLEHVTPEALVERLAVYLDDPTLCFQSGAKFVGRSGNLPDATPLDRMKTGQPFEVVRIYGDDVLQAYLKDSGITAGCRGQIIAVNDVGNILIETRQDHQITLTQAVAQQVFVQEVKDNKEISMTQEKRTLDQLSEGQTAKVRRVNGEGAIRQRLLDMGLTRGTEIKMVKTSPLGDPVEYTVRGYNLSLRKAEAKMIDVSISFRTD
ncbi:FeoA domain-containing protein [bacterium]|nr:FeoA domain-containing protein [bacterium]